MTDNTLLYVAIALAVLALAVYKYSKHREAKFQERNRLLFGKRSAKTPLLSATLWTNDSALT